MDKQIDGQQYVGTVIDRLTAETIYRSRPTTWADAQTKAERHARGERYAVQADVADDIRAAAVTIGRRGGMAVGNPSMRAFFECLACLVYVLGVFLLAVLMAFI